MSTALTVVANVTSKTPKTPKTHLRREKPQRRVGPRGSFEQFERLHTSSMLRNNLKHMGRSFSQAKRSMVLHTAASSGNLPVVRELLSRKVDPTPLLPDGRTRHAAPVPSP